MKLTRFFAVVGLWMSLALAPSSFAIGADDGLDGIETAAGLNQLELDTDAGACSDAERSQFFHRDNYAFTEAMSGCGRSTLASASRTSQCLTKKFPGLSLGCAKCFGTMVNCTAMECYSECAQSDTTAACNQCVTKACIPALTQCSGVSAADIPQRRPGA